MKKYLEYSDLQSNKFWYITQQNESLTIVFGKIGTKGQTQVKTFSSPADAEKEANKLIKSKIKKGYEEKAIPPTLEQSTCTEKTIIKMPDAPKPKYHPKPTPPKDVIDDGKEKPWFDLDEWADEGKPNPFDFDELRKVPPKKVAPVKQPPKQSNAPIKKETVTKTPQEQEFDNLKVLLRKYIKQGEQFDIEATFEQLKVLSPSTKVFQTLVKDTLEVIFSKFINKISPMHFDCITYLLTIKDPNIVVKEFYAQGALKYIYDNYQTRPDSIHRLAEEYLNDYPVQMADKIASTLQHIVDTIRVGGEDNIPAFKLPNHTYGFYITFDEKYLKIYPLNRDRDPKSYQSFAISDIEYNEPQYSDQINNQYFTPLLTEKLHKMLDNGFFEGITDHYFRIAFCNKDNIFIETPIEQTYRQTKILELESDLKYLEQSDEYDVDLLTDTVEEYFAYNRIIEQYDTDRILALLKKYLYSGEKEAESTGRSLLRKHIHVDFKKWWLVYLQFKWENFGFKYADIYIQDLVDKGYEPAILQKQAWDKLGIRDSKPGKKDDSDNQSETERFYDTFTETDVFCETETIIARAMPTGGEIYLRFKQESEQAYSDALDYLNNLMAKGYSNIFEGHWLNIYFVAKPEYYSEFAKYIEDYEDFEEYELGMGIACCSHVFFRKAAMYESLHDKIREFVNLTMYEFHHSRDLQDENNSVAGTFAAIALAMTDVKHMDLAIKFANETDGDHEYLASYFGIVLEKYWGITPETAVAIALLQLTHCQFISELSSQFYKIPQNLASLTDYYRNNEPKNPYCKLTYLVEYLFGEPSDSLKKLKELFNNATDPQEKLIYADFHNLVLEALKKEGEGSGQPIIYNISPKPESDSEPLIINEQDFIENPPCIITPLQAKKRGFDVRELETYDSPWRAVIFAPLTITNPYIFDAIIQFHKVQNNIGVRSVIIWGTEQAYCFGKKVVIDFSGTPYQVGMGIYAKNQAQLIYGVMDFAKIAVAMNKQAPDKEKLYALRKQYYYFDSPKGSPNIDKSKPGIMYLDEALGAGIYKDDNYRAIKQLEKITPDMGEVYDASLLFMAYMQQKKLDYAMETLQRKLDTTELKQVYQTAQKRLPQYQEYWQEKLAEL
ncbi:MULTISPECIES: DUF6138 family protein [unclassified Gilliamella]|uniref:DUF6138 family protein n=1 Tax=unclassified Gilliamella TaxID=2685620 RepID=UPI00226AAB8E|nr:MULTISPECIES: DUF6138 family protein [unclassified Gilliamella]MCX8601018.1 WGR domain-containing protein [Gilliamella sp. B3722]MCX8610240.1 WGR domain-containing protein [Gilliamella sp. B3891]MCX8612500.1 WGR domain-containing protein [Gilliamella sp. B3773]MCX8619947.1 WGR domain-containing protein [Gilliamella sp. B3892]MCX8622198.1 WGR domain-containing protein [Gilliamella sp. B3759]